MVQKEFISDLEKAAGKSKNEILFTDIAKQTGSLDNPWLIFFKYIDAVDQKCVKYMLPKWENKLGGGHRNLCQLIVSLCLSLEG